jgi:citrate lyase subunit beta / citryl-CoA lyase
MLKLHLESSVFSGLDGIILPKAETSEQVAETDMIITRLESERNITSGTISINLVVESAKGVVDMLKIATSSKRIQSISIGQEDLSLDLELGDSQANEVINFARYYAILVAHAAGISPLGLVGSVADLNPETYRQNAIKSRNFGFKGAMAINPSQVLILNEVFSPAQAEIEFAERIIESYERGKAREVGVRRVSEMMIDKPVYLRAKSLVERSKEIKTLENVRKGIIENSH